MKYRIDLNNLGAELKFIKDKNDLLQKCIDSLNDNLNYLEYESSNRESLNANYLSVVNKLATIQNKTDRFVNILRTKYNLYNELYEGKISNISNDNQYDGEFNYDKYRY